MTLPALRPSLGAASLLVALYTLSDFGAVSLMQYQALTRSIYLQYRSLFDRTPAAVLGLVLVALTVVLLVLEERSRRGVRASAPARPAAEAIPLGRWRWPAFAFCAAVVGFFLVVPLAVLVYWSARAVELGYGDRRSPGRRRSRPFRVRARRGDRGRRRCCLCAPRRALPGALDARRSSGSRTPATRCPGS